MPHAEPPDPNRRERQIELEILLHLTDPEDNQPVWALGDLAREMDLPCAVDYIRRLQRSGLVHCTSDGTSSPVAPRCVSFNSATAPAEPVPPYTGAPR